MKILRTIVLYIIATASITLLAKKVEEEQFRAKIPVSDLFMTDEEIAQAAVSQALHPVLLSAAQEQEDEAIAQVQERMVQRERNDALAQEIIRLRRPGSWQEEAFLEARLRRIQNLLDRGADPNHKMLSSDEHMVTPLYEAALRRVPAAVKILLEHGARITEDVLEVPLNQFTEAALMPFALTYVKDEYDILSLLIPHQEERKYKIMQFIQAQVAVPHKLRMINVMRTITLDDYLGDNPAKRAEYPNLTANEIVDTIESKIEALEKKKFEEEEIKLEEEVPPLETASID